MKTSKHTRPHTSGSGRIVREHQVKNALAVVGLVVLAVLVLLVLIVGVQHARG